MRILTCKQTHTGDPDRFGRFGVSDCIGRVRNLLHPPSYLDRHKSDPGFDSGPEATTRVSNFTLDHVP